MVPHGSLFMLMCNSLIDCEVVVTGMSPVTLFTSIDSCEMAASLCLADTSLSMPLGLSSVRNEIPHFFYELLLVTRTSSDNRYWKILSSCSNYTIQSFDSELILGFLGCSAFLTP